jgi:adenylate kinase
MRLAKVVLFVGPPGCGKGTQAVRIAAALGIPTISTGEMIRAEVSAGTELGKTAQGVMVSGGLLSDEIVNRIVASRLSKPDCEKGFLLDGYPRTVPQADSLSKLLTTLDFPQPTVVLIDVPLEMLVKRTVMRRSCPQCGAIYNLLSKPPKREGLCDVDGAALQQRADDQETTVRARLDAYEKNTAPLITYYAGGDYYRVDGTGSTDEVFQRIYSQVFHK